MTIRPARHEDLEQLVEMCALMHRESAYSFLPFDRNKVRRQILSFLGDSEEMFGRVAEEGGAIAGMLGGYLTDYFFCEEKLACDMVLFVAPEFRGGSAAARLIRAFREWAIAHEARELCLGVSTNVNTESIGRFYRAMGLALVGGVYKQRLTQE